MTRRLGGWAVGALTTFLVVYPAGGLSGQHVAVGPQIAFGDYREVSADLHFRGGGVGAAITATWKKLSIDAVASAIEYKPVDNPTGTLVPFKAKQVHVRLRYYLTGPVSAEIGFVNRKADPEFEAQSMGAVTVGARMAYLLGPGVRMGLRGGLLFGPKFSGGGSASPLGALELGLGVEVDGLRGRLRFTGDYDFQRITRTTDDGSGEVDVPIQQALGRIGIAIAF